LSQRVIVPKKEVVKITTSPGFLKKKKVIYAKKRIDRKERKSEIPPEHSKLQQQSLPSDELASAKDHQARVRKISEHRPYKPGMHR